MELKDKENIVILSIESSCDETAAAVVKNGRTVLSSVIATQIDVHRRFGGVVPEIASRNHVLSIESVVDEAMKKANVTPDDIDAIGVTYGAGLLGALLVGVSYAKGLCLEKTAFCRKSYNGASCGKLYRIRFKAAVSLYALQRRSYRSA